MITAQTAKTRINELIHNDEQNDEKSKRDNKQVLAYISLHLHRFYSHYSDNDLFGIEQASQQVDYWGLQEWKDAISSFDMSNWSDEATKRVKMYGAMASQDRKHLLIAILSLGMVGFAEKQQDNITNQLIHDGKNQLSYLSRNMNISSRKLSKIANDVINVDKGNWSNRLWTDNDSLANQVSVIINKHLKSGISLQDLSDQLNNYTNFNQFKNGTNIAGRLEVMDSNSSRLLRTESAKVVQEANYQTYQLAGVTKVEMVLQPGHCQLCGEIASNGPFNLSDVPSIPVHPNCRCTLIPIKTSFLKRVFR